MADLPYMKFFPTDWLADCSVLSLAARGAWQTLLCKMWHPDNRGSITLPLPAMARLLGATPDETEAALGEIRDLGIGSVSRDGDDYTVTSRRLSRDWESTCNANADVSERRREAANARWKMQKQCKSNANDDANQMQKQCKSNANDDANQMQNDAILESRSQKPDNISAATQRTCANDGHPSLGEVMKMVGSTTYALTSECAEAYFQDRESVGWMKRGQTITNWRSDLARYASHWKNNEHIRTNRQDNRPNAGSARGSGAADGIDMPML